MKHIISKMLLAGICLLPGAVAAQRVQLLPEYIDVIMIENYQKLRVVEGDESRLETMSDRKNFATVRGGKLRINSGDDDVTLSLAPGRGILIHAEDYSTVEVIGSFSECDVFGIETEDYATAHFSGTTDDTVRCRVLILHSEDFSRINSDVILKHFEYDLAASDYSRIELAGIDQMPNPTDSSFSLTTTISDFGKVYYGRITDNGKLVRASYPRDDHDYTTIVNDATGRIAASVRDGKGAEPSKEKKSSGWHSGDVGLSFAWGWHNWGGEMLDGFGGTDGASEVRTSFNNIQLSIDAVIIGNRWLRFYGGLGLEWDKWRFTTPEVNLDPTASPITFVAGSNTAMSSMLTTRYVVLPLSVSIGRSDGWHLNLAAIPGIHWNASGLKHSFEAADRTVKEKDRSVNKYINPYKLDLRAAVFYKSIGVYAQVSTLSTFRDNCEPLFPVKFGIIL